MDFLKKMFGDGNARAVKKLQPTVEQINACEGALKKLSDAELRHKTVEFKERLAKGETLDDLLPEAFAVVREASERATGMRHYDVQLIGGMVLHRGQIAEMRTGEGKTLVATLPVYLNALSGQGVHVVTVNDYLAKRDAVWMGKIYDFLGLTVGVVQNQRVTYVYDAARKLPPADAAGGENQERAATESEIESFKVENEYLRPASRQEAYRCDITYGTNNEFGFDYLRDNMVQDLSDMVMRPGSEMHYAIVDEVDSILIDEARTPLIISAPAEEATEQYYQFAELVRRLKENEDYNVDEKLRSVTLTEEGIRKFEEWLGIGNIYEEGGIRIVHHIEQALKAEVLFKRDRDYMVEEGEVIIIDEFTGRKMPGRRYSEGLHQAIEAKESVPIQRESQTLATITFQNLFRMYGKLAGMTGTAATESEEFYKIYALEVVVIPTNRPDRRADLSDRIYKTEAAKFRAAAEKIKECRAKNQPILVGTISVEKNERLSEYLTALGIEHETLNAKNHEREGEIIAQAGRPGAVTLATNMAGRGVDIKLGGVPADAADAEKVVAAGGLFVLGTERHESRRIDNQLRGRSGRQGDPGSSRFYLSLDDALMRIFAGERVKAIMDKLKMPEGEAIEAGMVTRSIESAQRKVEARNFDMRKQLLEYDDVANDQRKVIYQQRNEILDATDLSAQIQSLREGCFEDVVRQYVPAESVEEQWDLPALERVLSDEWQMTLPLQHQVNAASAITDHDILDTVRSHANTVFDEKVALVGNENFTQFERMVLLQSIDSNWRDHLSSLDYLRQGIHLRGYAQKQPKQEYKREAFELFGQMLDAVKNEVTKILMTVRIQSNEEAAAAAVELENRAERISNVTYTAPTETGGVEIKVDETTMPLEVPRVGRNEPCPCGSGKKYKQCHGKLA